MDIALCIEKLLPAAKYGGSTTANTKEAYDKLRWEDERNKPTWEELQGADVLVVVEQGKKKELEELEVKVQAEMRSQAIDSLQNKGAITSTQAKDLKEKHGTNKGSEVPHIDK